MKVGIIGIGGTGGYISAMLCKNNEEVYLIARGKNLDVIKEKGLTLNSEVEGNFVVKPKVVTNDSNEAGIMDVIFVCVKGYSLEEAAKSILPMVDEHTIVIPIINGVNGDSKLYSYLRKGQVAEGVIYIVSQIERPGVINHTTKNKKVIIGENKKRPIDKNALKEVYKILTNARIICEIREDVEVAAWEKYIFNCAFNITDSYYDVNTKGIIEDEEKFNTFCNLAKECEVIGRAKGVNLPNDIYDTTLNILKNLDGSSTSSMHRDVSNKKKFELELFSGELIKMGDELGIPTPYSKKAYEKLNKLQHK
ncbi:ketopantoate reductase family protein [Clostridium sp.]|uniref:ketopantoate reductase family protein n=1 Tax=Clostridium sp. TaxID=1506 RepID=UPI002622E112|nr:ketopantoate reductase family protein [Clostridium sp.]